MTNSTAERHDDAGRWEQRGRHGWVLVEPSEDWLRRSHPLRIDKSGPISVGDEVTATWHHPDQTAEWAVQGERITDADGDPELVVEATEPGPLVIRCRRREAEIEVTDDED